MSEHKPVTLPNEPRLFRVHHDGRTQDCTLHPDGRLTAHMGGEDWVSALTLDQMLCMNWADARIEWDPDPLTPDEDPALDLPAHSLREKT